MIPKFHDGRDSFFDRKLGMFVHWGLYSIPAWHEQELWRKGTPRREYEKLIHEFNPVNFDPDKWIDAAEDAGMSYICITTKHHDGFCLWDTKQTDYNIMHTPYGKEFTKPTQACSAFGRESWGYRIDEDYYSDKFTIASIDKIFTMGGTYLLNVGPKADGTLPEENVQSLHVIGDWLRAVGEAFDGTYPASYMVSDDQIVIGEPVVRDRIYTTRKDNTLYLHLPDGLNSTGLIVSPLHILPKKATLLNNGQELKCLVDMTPWHWHDPEFLRIVGLPVNEMQHTVMVIKLEFDEEAFA